MPMNYPKIAISDKEYLIHKRNRFLRYIIKPAYPIIIESGQAITEFVALADKCKSMGLSVIPHGEIKKCLDKGEAVLKFGKTDINSDILSLSHYSHPYSEWNLTNLEKVLDWHQYVPSERRLWNLFLDNEEHLSLLKQLFCQNGSLFIKTKTKGSAGIYNKFDDFFNSLPDLSLLCEESKERLVSEVVQIKEIKARVSRKIETRKDEWRHYIYKEKLITSTHAFDCDEKLTDHSGYKKNVEKALNVIEILSKAHFATSYVLDTCTLTDGTVTVVEINSFFSSGLYNKHTVELIAKGIFSN